MSEASEHTNPVTCATCGAPWPKGGSVDGCPECGGTSKSVHITAAEEAGVAESVSVSKAVHISVADEISVAESLETELIPGDQDHDWRRRWKAIERDLGRLEAPRTNPRDGDNIHAAADEVRRFWVAAYHLKDGVIVAKPRGLSKQQVENAISNDPDLALLADLANLDKHFNLTHGPRSGDRPVVAQISGKQAGSGEGGWRLKMELTHRGQTLDALKVARASVDAWRRHLTGWGLI